MNSSRIEWTGLNELKQALRQLPEDLTQEANAIVQETVQGAKQDVQIAYPEGPTGNLRRGVTSRMDYSRFGARGEVRSRAKHAWIFEHGTAERSYRTKQTGAVHRTGRSKEAPEAQQMIPVVMRRRARMYEQLIALVRRAGFVVEDVTR